MPYSFDVQTPTCVIRFGSIAAVLIAFTVGFASQIIVANDNAFSELQERPTRQVDVVRSLGDHIRVASSTRVPSDESPETIDAPALTRDQSTQNHLALLNKPMSRIQLYNLNADAVTPENLADRVLSNESPTLVAGLGYLAPGPDRYTIRQTHRPLYFEQPLLERCGRGCGVLQNGISGATFMANTLLLPGKMLIQRPDCTVPAGDDCLTCQAYRHPYDFLYLMRRSPAPRP